MVPDRARKAVRAARMFADLGDPDCDAVVRLLTPQLLAQDQVLFRQGDRGDSLFIVVDGALEVCAGTRGDEERVEAGGVLGELACIDPGTRWATARAAEPTLVYALNRFSFARLREVAPAAAAALVGSVVAGLARRLREVDARIAEEPGAVTPLPLERKAVARPITVASPPPPGSHPGTAAAVPSWTREEVELLAEIAVRREFKPGDVITREGEEGHSCFLLAAGQVEVSKSLAGGECVVAIQGPGALVGQVALVADTSRSATIRAVSQVLALELTREEFEQLLSSLRPIALLIQLHIAIAGSRQLRVADERLALLRARPAEEGPVVLDAARTASEDWDLDIGAGEAEPSAEGQEQQG